jgi:hypothetical protein
LRVGAHFDEPPLQWESDLRGTRPAGPRILNIDRSFVAILITIALGGTVIAAVGLHDEGTVLQVAVVLGDAAILIAAAAVYGAAESRMRAEIAGRQRSPRRRSAGRSA